MISGYLLPKGFFTCIDDIAFATFGYRFYSLFNIFFLVNSCLPSSSRIGATALNIFFPTRGKIDLADLASIPNIPPPPLLYLDVPQNTPKPPCCIYVSIASFFAHFHFLLLRVNSFNFSIRRISRRLFFSSLTLNIALPQLMFWIRWG